MVEPYGGRDLLINSETSYLLLVNKMQNSKSVICFWWIRSKDDYDLVVDKS